VDVEEHRRKRKIISLPITEKSTRAFEPIMITEVNKFTKQILESMERSEPINMTDRCQNLSVDVIGQLAFGYPLNLQTKADNRWLLPGLRIGGHRNNTYMQFPKLKVLEPFLKFLGRKGRQKYLQIMTTMIKYRLSLTKDAKHDLYSFAINHMELSSGLRASELWAEAFFFIIAGSTTPSTVTSAMFFYLSRYPKSRRRLTEEIRSVFSSADDVVSGDKLRSCKYLHACINETLRIATPDTAIFWREAVDEDEKGRPFTSPPVVDGHIIPKGTIVGVNLYSLHHNEKYFPDPFAFKPERWFENTEDEDSVTHKAFAPFLLGARSCAGRAFALMEISLTIAKTLWLFNFEKAPGQLGEVGGGEVGRIDGRGRPEEFQLYDIFTAVHDGPYLVFSPRD
jgi:cytochrome P450